MSVPDGVVSENEIELPLKSDKGMGNENLMETNLQGEAKDVINTIMTHIGEEAGRQINLRGAQSNDSIVAEQLYLPKEREDSDGNATIATRNSESYVESVLSEPDDAIH